MAKHRRFLITSYSRNPIIRAKYGTETTKYRSSVKSEKEARLDALQYMMMKNHRVLKIEKLDDNPVAQ